VEGEEVALSPQMAIRVGPRTKRKIHGGPDGAQILVVGGIPGGVYEPPPFTELGGPDPVASPELLQD
jgi:hypothetical protein